MEGKIFRRLQKIWIFLAIFGLLVLSSTVYLIFNSKKALAAQPGDQDNVDLHIKVEASSDNGVTWVNFSGTEEGDGQTLNVNPGGQIEFQIKVWNTGILDADDVDIEANATNEGYVTGSDVDDTDLDNDGFDFNGFAFANGGAGTVAGVTAGSTEGAGFQGLHGTIQLSNNFPAGQTVLTGEVFIDDYEPGLIGFNPFRSIARAIAIRHAFADGVGRQSGIRIAINVAGGNSGGTKVTPTPTPTQIAQVTNLPQTGGGTLDDSIR